MELNLNFFNPGLKAGRQFFLKEQFSFYRLNAFLRICMVPFDENISLSTLNHMLFYAGFYCIPHYFDLFGTCFSKDLSPIRTCTLQHEGGIHPSCYITPSLRWRKYTSPSLQSFVRLTSNILTAKLPLNLR